jgi:hypothetical protein
MGVSDGAPWNFLMYKLIIHHIMSEDIFQRKMKFKCLNQALLHHFTCQILMQCIAPVNGNQLQKWHSPHWKRQRNMTSPDVTEQRIAINLCWPQKKPHYKLEATENMSKVSRAFYICVIWVFLRSRNSVLDAAQEEWVGWT